MGRFKWIFKRKFTIATLLIEKIIMTGDHAVYAITKSAAVDLIEHYHQEFGIKNFILDYQIYIYIAQIFITM